MISSKKWTQCCAEKAPTRDCKYNVRILRQICMWPRSLHVSRVFFYARRFSNQEVTKFCVVQEDFENSVTKTGASTQSSFKGVLYPKMNAFIYKTIWGTILVPRLEELRSLTSKMSFSLSHVTPVNTRVHTWRGIMGNQGKISRKQGSKMYVFLHISVLISNLVTKHIQYAE